MTSLTNQTGWDKFASLPLDEQMHSLGRALDNGQAAGELLAPCAAVGDDAPLAFLVGELLRRGLLASAAAREELADFLVEQDETAVHRILREGARIATTLMGATGHAWRDALLAALVRVPITRLSSMCLLDRALKQQFPDARDAHVEMVVSDVEQALAKGVLPTSSVLVQVPANATERLEAAARTGGVASGLATARQQMASEVTRVLRNAPKGVSQANAEELLARRVYTDPGHFLIELLQNAEDAGAKKWHVTFDQERIVVWHDGMPFDARDVVGVTSIGQTTKRKQQIGFFGVGFKSVYEVTDRPRIYSDIYQFEIADVSVPKELGERPKDLPADGTVLVLPFRAGLDEVRSPAALYEKARALDPCVLFPLAAIDEIDIRLTQTAGGPSRHAVFEQRKGAISSIRHEPGGALRHYRVVSAVHRYLQGGREVGRPDSTRIMVGVRVDEAGRPQPLGEDASTVYAYLPTAEHSGLRFFVQGHFDVPVDRERINPDVPWNRWILSKVPTALAELAAELETVDDARGFLDVLPLRAELAAPVFGNIIATLPQALANVRFLPGADGVLHEPRVVLVATPEIVDIVGTDLPAALLTGATAGAGAGGLRPFLDNDLPERSVQVATQLGCRRFELPQLLDVLERCLGKVEDGGRPTGELPQLLRQLEPDKFAELYDLLLQEHERLTREQRRLEARRFLERLTRLPLVLCEDGHLYRCGAGDPSEQAPIVPDFGLLGAIYKGVSPFVDPRMLEGERVTAFLKLLGVRVPTAETLADDLEAALAGRRRLESFVGLSLPDSLERLAVIWRFLSHQRRDIVERVSRLPLFPAHDGSFRPIADGHEDLDGLLLAPSTPLGEGLAAFYRDHAKRRGVWDTQAHDAGSAPLIRLIDPPLLSLDLLTTDLQRAGQNTVFGLGTEDLAVLHELLERVRDEITDRQRQQLAATRVWPDRAGKARALTGPAPLRCSIPHDEEIVELLPGLHFLDSTVAQRAHVRQMGVDPIGPAALVEHLGATGIADLTTESVDDMVGYLGRHCTDLPIAVVRRALGLPIFRDTAGEYGKLVEELATIRQMVALFEPDLARFMQLLGFRACAPDVAELASPLIEAGGLSTLGIEALVTALAEIPVDQVGDRGLDAIIDDLHELLVRRADDLREKLSGGADGHPTLMRMPIWPTQRGSLETAASLADVSDLLDELPPGLSLRDELLEHALAPKARNTFAALAPLVVEVSAKEVLAEVVHDAVRPGQPLSTQVDYLASPELVALIARFLPTQRHAPLVDGRGRVVTNTLQRADEATLTLATGLPIAKNLAHPTMASVAAHRKRQLQPLDREALLEAVAESDLGQPQRRAALYRWLIDGQAEIFADPRCRVLIASSPLFVTTRGSLLPASELVLDADLPDLGIDWTPSDEIPPPLLEILRRQLDVGAPDLRSLTTTHLLPAYHAAVDNRDCERAGAVLNYLAKQVVGWRSSDIRELLETQSRPLHIESDAGDFVAPDELLDPPPELVPWIRAVWGTAYAGPSTSRYVPEAGHLWRAIGVPTVPPTARVVQALNWPGASVKRARGLAAVIGHLVTGSPEVVDELPLSRPWVVDAAGRSRRPDELYLRNRQLEALIGEFPDIFVDGELVNLLGSAVTHVPFRQGGDVQLSDVARNIRACADSSVPLSHVVYDWLEQCLEADLVTVADIHRELPHAWVCADDGRFFAPDRVLGTLAFRFFGERRGYWERGRRQFPRLFSAFSIAKDVTPEVVHGFLVEIGEEVKSRGEQSVMDDDPALPRMLLACAALLGHHDRGIPRSVSALVCRQAGRDTSSAKRGDTRLLSAGGAAVFRSETPHLESLFEGVAPFFLVHAGRVDDRADLDAFYDNLAVPRLHEAYTIEVDNRAGRDVTDVVGESIVALRHILRPLCDLMPRVQAKRSELPQSGWIYEERLRPLAAAGRIRAIDDLRVRYTLPRVGSASAKADAVYDPSQCVFLVDRAVFDEPHRHTTGLALGLMACIYDGPGDDTVADIVELLLQLGNRARMARHLDAKHYPRLSSSSSPADRVVERLAEVLDYGLHHRLRESFDELEHAHLDRWRDTELTAELAALDGSGETLQRSAVTLLLEHVGLDDASGDLRDRLGDLLTAPDLAAAAREIVVIDEPETASATVTPGPQVLPERPGPAGLRSTPVPTAPTRPPVPVQGGADVIAWLQDEGRGDPGIFSKNAADLDTPTWTTPGQPDEAGAEPLVEVTDFLPPPKKRSIWSRIGDALGFGGGEPASTIADRRPSWATPSVSNVLAPVPGVPPQLWATAAARQHLSAHTPETTIQFSPSRLPVPYIYAIFNAGVTFDEHTQAWSASHTLDLNRYMPEMPSGRTVAFEGRLCPGVSVLPLPLYGRLAEPPQVVSGPVDALRAPQSRQTHGQLLVEVRSDEPIIVGYEVELFDVPPITQSGFDVDTPRTWTAPFVSMRSLPKALRNWMNRLSGSDWNRALAIQGFVREHYLYDDEFLTRPAARQCLAELRLGKGAHHLELLHAGGDHDHLGRGICYELNMLVVALLRLAEIPSLFCSGWVLDEGRIDRPDHAFALAILPSPEGPALFPLDAANGIRGPIHTLPRQASAPTPFEVISAKEIIPTKAPEPRGPGPTTPSIMAPLPIDIPAPSGPWSGGNVIDTADAHVPDAGVRIAQEESLRLREEFFLLARALVLFHEAQRLPFPNELAQLTDQIRARQLQQQCGQLRQELVKRLGQEATAALLAIMRGDMSEVGRLTPAIQRLADLDLIGVRSHEVYRVFARDRVLRQVKPSS